MLGKDRNGAGVHQRGNDGRPDRPGILSLIGNTPLVPIRQLNPNPGVEIYAKVEKSSPGGSVKDRIGLWMIEEAERQDATRVRVLQRKRKERASKRPGDQRPQNGSSQQP